MNFTDREKTVPYFYPETDLQLSQINVDNSHRKSVQNSIYQHNGNRVSGIHNLKRLMKSNDIKV